MKIEPLWRDDKILVFRANLPLTDRHLYLRYHIQSWPIPGNTSEFRTQLQVPSDIAFHTETGGIFSPTGCMGENPAICRTGPIFDRTMMKCSRGILTGEAQLRRHCYVTISKVHERTNTVKEILPGAAIISTYGEAISLLCTGQTEKRVTLVGGLYLLTIPSNCRINGEGWTLSGLIHRSLQIAMELPVIKIQPFNLSTIVSHESVVQHLKSPHWTLLDKVENIRLSSLTVSADDTSGIIWKSSPHSILWTTLGIILLLSVVVILAILVFQKLRKKRDGQALEALETNHEQTHELTDDIELVTRRSNLHTRHDQLNMPRDELTTRHDQRNTRVEPTRTIDAPMLACDEAASLSSSRLRVEPWGHVNTALY